MVQGYSSSLPMPVDQLRQHHLSCYSTPSAQDCKFIDPLLRNHCHFSLEIESLYSFTKLFPSLLSPACFFCLHLDFMTNLFHLANNSSTASRVEQLATSISLLAPRPQPPILETLLFNFNQILHPTYMQTTPNHLQSICIAPTNKPSFEDSQSDSP